MSAQVSEPALSAPAAGPCEAASRSGDPDLTAIVSAWPTLPHALRAGIVAMVKAAGSAQP